VAVKVLVGTKKGLFVLSGDAERRSWEVEGPLLTGFSVYHAIRDPRDGALYAATNFFGSNSLYSCGTAQDTYRWTPSIPTSGTYNVYVWWTAHANRSTAVPISVVHANGTTTTSFNQQVGGGQWVLHGQYTFNAGTGGYVQVSAANGQAAADAVRWVPVP